MTDTMTKTRDTSTDPSDTQAEPKPRRLDLSATQLIAGALAAMTAAVIGARLGVGGTVTGAAVGSLVAGVAGSLYTTSLRHTKDRIHSVVVGRVGDTQVAVAEVSADTLTDVTRSDQAGWSWDDPSATTPLPAAMAPASAAPVATEAEVGASGRPGRRVPWKPILASSAAVFALAVAGITGFELVSGQSVSGGEGTTITQVSEGSGGSDTPTQAPSSASSGEPTAEPSTTPDTGASSVPSAETSAEPSATAEPSAEPSQTPAPSTSSAPSAEPSQSAGGAGSEVEGGVNGSAAGP